jgi:hypothetical protein
MPGGTVPSLTLPAPATHVFEDVTFGVVARGKEELRSFANRAFAAVPDFKYGLRSRFAASHWAAIEWVMSGTHKGKLPRDTGHWQTLFVGAGLDHPRTGGREDPPRI